MARRSVFYGDLYEGDGWIKVDRRRRFQKQAPKADLRNLDKPFSLLPSVRHRLPTGACTVDRHEPEEAAGRRRLHLFETIAQQFGRVLIPFDCNPDSNNMSSGRLCILTAKMETLNLDNITVKWKEFAFNICIQEDGVWNPPFSYDCSKFEDESEGSELVSSFPGNDIGHGPTDDGPELCSGPEINTKLPDLNGPSCHLDNALKSNNEIQGICNSHRRAFSVKFKDIIKSSKQHKRTAKRNTDSGRKCFSSSKSSHESVSCDSLASEINKTMGVGDSLGYQLQGTECLFRQIIIGEGAEKTSK
ncbi:hypothetical protein L2E82_35702 [Cichorium intybus]|uniref:Uncharacterized protein n=1 Tax=Cichorium intybus TaxID=13427 RepID=A0ACB9BPN9_CICIN|nr:hypothetical protein L2E82_35702 [Cichorium intybus]